MDAISSWQSIIDSVSAIGHPGNIPEAIIARPMDCPSGHALDEQSRQDLDGFSLSGSTGSVQDQVRHYTLNMWNVNSAAPVQSGSFLHHHHFSSGNNNTWDDDHNNSSHPHRYHHPASSKLYATTTITTTPPPVLEEEEESPQSVPFDSYYPTCACATVKEPSASFTPIGNDNQGSATTTTSSSLAPPVSFLRHPSEATMECRFVLPRGPPPRFNQ